MADWSVIVFETKTGRIVNNDLSVVGMPQFNRQINQPGSVQVKILVGDLSTPSKEILRSLATGWRFSLGVVYGGGLSSSSYIAQAGPVMTHQYNEQDDTLTLTCGGFWTILNHRMLMNPTTGGASPEQSATSGSGILDMSSTYDLTYSGLSLHSIAKSIVQDNCTRFGMSLPVDFPTTITGTATRTYPVYDLATAGQRLQEITQVDQGPDIDFAPYFDPSNPGYVRWNMLIGNPTLAQLGLNYYWDYGSSLETITTDSDASSMASGIYVKGNSTERSTTVAYQNSTVLTSAGWPAIESIDTSHSSVIDNTVLNGYATADIGLYKSPVEMWTCIVRAAEQPNFGTFNPGTYATFNVIGHRWVPDGQYTQRILGFTQGQNTGEVKLILQAIQGAA